MPHTAGPAPRPWTVLTNHGLLLVLLARQPDGTVRELAEVAGLTERATARILADLRASGYVSATRVGRRNRYRVHLERPMRHPATSDRPVADVLARLIDSDGASRLGPTRRGSRARG